MYCIVQNCKNVWSPNSDIKFHSFPKDIERRNTWLTSIRIKGNFYSSARICSLHFKPEDYNPEMPGKLLNSAIPHFSCHPSESSTTFIEEKFCMICLDPHRKLYQPSKYNLDMEYENLTGISLGDVVNFTPMFCSECAQRLVNCGKFRDKSLRAFQLLTELLHNNAELSLQTLSSVDRARCQLTSSVVKKTFEPDHCDLYVTEDTRSIDKVKNEKFDLYEKLHLKCETNLDLELESGEICDDAAEFIADDVNTDVEITNDDANDGVNVVYIDDSSNDDLYNHGDNMKGAKQSNTNVKSHEKKPKILNHNTTAIRNADAKWLNVDIDIDFDVKEDIQQAANDVYRRGENVKSIPSYSNINEDNKYLPSKNFDSTKYIAIGDDIANKERVKDENDELSDYYEEIGVIPLDDDIGYDINHGSQSVKIENVSFVKENVSNPDKVNGGKTVANKTNKTRNNDDNNIVSLNNVMRVRETDKRSVSSRTNANATRVLVKKRAAKRKQPPSDEKKSLRKRSRKIISLPPQEVEEPISEKFKWFRKIERSPEEQIADWAQRRESDRYRDTRYKCTDCFKSFKVEKTYNLHMEKHSDKYGAIECHICRVRVKTRSFLTDHNRRTHKFLYRCTKCAFVTNFSEVASNHSRWHDGKTYECPHCGKVFTKPTTYYGHVRFAHPSDTVCALCGYSFIGKRGLWMHQRKVHRDDKQELSGPQCSQCNVRFASEAAYDTHLQVSPKHGAPRDLKRNDASVGILEKPEFPRKETLAGLDLASEEGTRRIRRTNKKCIKSCKLCNAVLESRLKYHWHLRHYHPDSVDIEPTKRAYMCEQCGKLCISNYDLQDHMLRHDSKKVECNACDKKFYSTKALKDHVERIHDDAQRHTYLCAHCAYQTKERGNFRRHTQIHTDLNARRWFHCTLCEKKTTTSQALQRHILHVHEKVPWPARVRASRARASAPRTRDID